MARRPPDPPAIQSAWVPPPKGMNQRDPLVNLPQGDALYIYDMISSDLGLRARMGYQAAVSAALGNASGGVLTMIPYHGTKKDGTADRLFASGATGIYRVDDNSRTKVVGFRNSTTTDSGRCIFTAMTTVGGSQVAFVCDEAFGLSIYDEATDAWLLASAQPVWPRWGIQSPQITYNVGTIVVNNDSGTDRLYICSTKGTSATSGGGPTGTTTGIAEGTGGTAKWDCVNSTNVTARTASHTYVAGDLHKLFQNTSGDIFMLSTVGTTNANVPGPQPPAYGTGGANIPEIAPNTAKWDYILNHSQTAPPTTSVGPSLDDENTHGYFLHPGNLVFCTVYKNHAWFVERNTGRAWIAGLNSIYGSITSFGVFGARAKSTQLMGLYTWSYDGGGGLSTMLVGISSAGDVTILSIYGDPSVANPNITVLGSWNAGSLPYGRNIAVEHGADILILTKLGVIPLSQLVTGKLPADSAMYLTHPIQNLFIKYMQQYSTTAGWSIRLDASEGALAIVVPVVNHQLMMDFTTKKWSEFRRTTLQCLDTFQGNTYWGDSGDKVQETLGYADAVAYDGTGGTGISYSFQYGFVSFGGKRINLVECRPTVISLVAGTLAYLKATAKYDGDIAEPALTTGQGVITPAYVTQPTPAPLVMGAYVTETAMRGLVGSGFVASVYIQGQAYSRTIFCGMQLEYTLGGNN